MLCAAAAVRGRAAGTARRRAFAAVQTTPGRTPPGRPPLLLVLDLDETLVRVCCEGVHHNRSLPRVDFRVMVDVGEPPKTTSFDCGVAMRPGLESFLEWIQERRDAGMVEGPWLYTTATANITKAVLRRIDPGGKIFRMRVLTREACVPVRMPGFFLKDLGRVPSEAGCQSLRRRVLVDNNPVSCIMNPESSVLVRDWLGNDPADAELERVRSVIDTMVEREQALEEEDSGDYVSHLSQLIPGHATFRERLQELGLRLDASPPTEVKSLRSAMKSAMAECMDIKRELLGAAP